jgi:hypothetical protein
MRETIIENNFQVSRTNLLPQLRFFGNFVEATARQSQASEVVVPNERKDVEDDFVAQPSERPAFSTTRQHPRHMRRGTSRIVSQFNCSRNKKMYAA